ncbi:hypothetical protein ACFYKT_14560 [Cytobacillus sp. FJAT-53684]|uniref:Uncharacterized protein n=1 Tax=Cytobacillus mangrovibacter TaxID=3299024 RepID=A0ABW6K4B7_9BACI
MADKNELKKFNGRVVHDGTINDHFKELHGITIEEWNEKNFKARTGMSSEECYIKQITNFIPVDYIKERNGKITEEDINVVHYLQALGLKEAVINVLFDYVGVFSSVGLIPPDPREGGKYWVEQNISSIDKAIIFARSKWITEWNRYKD